MQDRIEHLDAAKGHVEDAMEAVAKAWGRTQRAGTTDYNYSLEGAMNSLRHVLGDLDAAVYPDEDQAEAVPA